MKRVIIFFFISCSLTALTNAQRIVNENDKKDIRTYITARFNNGMVMPHHSSMSYLVEDFTRGFDITIGKRYFLKDHWTSLFNYPEIGFGFHYETLGNNDIFGVGIAAYHYINYNIYRTSKLSINNKIAAGLGIGTKPFDIYKNVYNDVSGSLVNVFIGFGVNVDYRVSPKISLSFSTDVNHMSNGAIKRPNSGINLLTTGLGAKYHFNTEPTPVYKRIKPEKQNLHQILLVGNLGFSQPRPFDTQKYLSGSFSANYLYRFSKKKSVGIGFDQFYSRAAPYAWGVYDDRYKEKTYNLDNYLFNGVFASYNIHLSKTTIFMNLGVYLVTGTKPQQPFYPRIGLRHQLNKKLLASFGIKAGFFKSEFLEFGLGYKFNLSKN